VIPPSLWWWGGGGGAGMAGPNHRPPNLLRARDHLAIFCP
jgi:hypothetical protein